MLTQTATAASAATAHAVTATAVTRRYGEGESAVHALRGVTLEVPVGQFAAIMGPSGSGKSTLMHLLAGLDRPSGGSVVVDGQELAGLDDGALTKLRRNRLGFVFQAFNLVPVLSAAENIMLPPTLAGRRGGRPHRRPARRRDRPRRHREGDRGRAGSHEGHRLMLRIALRGLVARKLRTVLTMFAVVIGVAFVSGTFVFTDTINESFK